MENYFDKRKKTLRNNKIFSFCMISIAIIVITSYLFNITTLSIWSYVTIGIWLFNIILNVISIRNNNKYRIELEEEYMLFLKNTEPEKYFKENRIKKFKRLKNEIK